MDAAAIAPHPAELVFFVGLAVGIVVALVVWRLWRDRRIPGWLALVLAALALFVPYVGGPGVLLMLLLTWTSWGRRLTGRTARNPAQTD